VAERDDTGKDDGNGCVIAAVIAAIAALVAGAMSLAAVVDPFTWLPTVEELWSDCGGDECDLADRFPGYWGHTALNLVYDIAALLLVVGLAISAYEYPRNRTMRYRSPEDHDRWRQGRSELFQIAGLLVALAAIPIVVAAA
jgi:hypothetical protein